MTTRNFRAAASSDIFLSVRCLRNGLPQGWAERAESAEDSRDESPPSEEDDDDDDDEEAEDSRLLLLSEMSARSSSRVRGARDCSRQWGNENVYLSNKYNVSAHRLAALGQLAEGGPHDAGETGVGIRGGGGRSSGAHLEMLPPLLLTSFAVDAKALFFFHNQSE